MRIGEGVGRAISPDGKWVITQPLRSNELILVPTGAGEARRLTHDNINYGVVRFLPDGKHLLASGIESGHGARDYLIDVSTGEPKPITPEGIVGVVPSPDGHETAVVQPDGSWGIWPLTETGSGFQPIANLNVRQYSVSTWSPDGQSLLVFPSASQKTAKVYRVNIKTGKMEFWKEFGASLAKDAVFTARPTFSLDGSAYVYVYDQVLSQSYVVKGLK